MSKKTFVSYYDWYEYCDGMSDKQKANLFDCIRTYPLVTSRIEPLPEIQFVWNKIKKQLDRHGEEYDKICKRNKENADKRWKGKGGTSDSPDVPVASSGYQSMLDTDTDTDTDTKKEKNILYGKFVRMTEIEYEKLCNRWDRQKVDDVIEDMNIYCSNKKKGNTYTDYYMALIKWIKKNIKDSPPKKKSKRKALCTDKD